MAGFDGRAFQQFELHGWSEKAAGYHRFYGPITSMIIPTLLDVACVQAGSRVLDVGSGPGYVLAAAGDRGAWPVAVDQALPMAQLARRLHSGPRYLVADAQAPPLKSESVSAVVGNFVLHHLPQQDAAIAAWARILATGGGLAMTVRNTYDKCRFMGVFNDAIVAANAPTPESVPPGPPMASDPMVYKQLLEDAGFDACAVTPIDWAQDFGTPDEHWDGLLASSVRLAALITEQPPDVIARIRARYDDLVVPYLLGDTLRLPVSVLLISGRRP
jgi:SAM-dependent methyltransferase